MDLTDTIVTFILVTSVNRLDLETYRLTSVVVQIRRCYVYTKQMYTSFFIHNASLEIYVRFQHKSLNIICDLIEK